LLRFSGEREILMDDLGMEVILAQLRQHRQKLEESVKRYDSATTAELLDRLTDLRQRAEELLRERKPDEK
jgi:hypothetical protein